MAIGVKRQPSKPGAAGSGDALGVPIPAIEQLTLLETIVILCITAAIIIFVFAMSAAALGDQLRLPEFLSDSVRTLWSLVTAGGLAIAGSVADSVLRKQPRTISYVRYILLTTVAIFVPIIGLMIYGNVNRNSWTVPNKATPINIIRQSFGKRGFEMATLTAPGPVGLYVSGDVTLSDGKLKGKASGRATKQLFVGPANPGVSTATQLGIHLCFYERQGGSPFVSVGVAPRFPQSSNTGTANVPIPLTADAVDIPQFDFAIDVPDMSHPEAVWLCAYLSDRNNQGLVGVF